MLKSGVGKNKGEYFMNDILKFIIGKTIRILSLLAALCILSFVLISHSPIDPVQAYIGADMLKVSQLQREKIAEHWGLDKPPVERFMQWSKSIIRGNFGTSMIYRAPVLDVIKERFT